MNASSMRALGGLVLISFLLTQAAPAYAADAPSPKPTPTIRLEDLGFKNLETKPNLELQSDLDRRHSMLGLHQTMAFVTWGLMAGTVLLSEQAKSNDWHQRLGMVTGASYYTTAYLSMFAPDPLDCTIVLESEVTDAKGLRHIHEFTRVADLPWWQKGPLFRHPKMSSNLMIDEYEPQREMTARHVARTLGLGPEAFPIVVSLYYRVTPPPPLGADKADPLTTFIASITILLREGVEALLIVVGMVAFLKKAERRDVLAYVHGGWIVALACGGLTWAAATYFVSISGASREVTEGLSSLFAAIVLLSVGLWMHQKSTAGKWQAYLKDKLSAAMTRRSAWALFALSFIAVYREVFETVLFYSALAGDGNNGALLGGLLGGMAVLAILAWFMLRTSARMPIGKFFSLSSILVAVLAVVLAGKGVAGLQEAGWLSASPIHWPRIEVLGIYPSAETTIAQAVVLVIALAGFALNSAKARRPRPA